MFTLITLREWETLERYIATRKKNTTTKERYTCKSKCSSDCEAKHSILQYACKFREIPLSTIVAILDVSPCAISEPDCIGRLPLHCAARSGVRSTIIQHLLQEYPEASVKQDEKGKTPLHLACKYFNEAYDDSGIFFKYKEDRKMHLSSTLNLVLAMFLNAEPYSFLIEDRKGMNALEYAIEGEVAYDTIFLMQKAIEHIQKVKISQNSTHTKEMLDTTIDRDGLMSIEPTMKSFTKYSAAA